MLFTTYHVTFWGPKTDKVHALMTSYCRRNTEFEWTDICRIKAGLPVSIPHWWNSQNYRINYFFPGLINLEEEYFGKITIRKEEGLLRAMSAMILLFLIQFTYGWAGRGSTSKYLFFLKERQDSVLLSRSAFPEPLCPVFPTLRLSLGSGVYPVVSGLKTNELAISFIYLTFIHEFNREIVLSTSCAPCCTR